MSQARSDNDKVNYYRSRNKPLNWNKPNFKRYKDKDKAKYFYHPRFQYYNAPFQPHWNFMRWNRPVYRKKPPTPEKLPSRPPSPFCGTEEYTMKKIQETSDMIKKQLMMPPDAVDIIQKSVPVVPVSVSETVNEEKKSESEKTVKTVKKPVHYNVEEIHEKIITHITNLNHGKKMNLICATSTGYDVAIQQIHKQKRLELSKVLRDMCENQTAGNSNAFNAIIPDIGIKLEDLPLEVIQELSSTLDLNFDDTCLHRNDDGSVKVKTEVCDSDEIVTDCPILSNIKVENCDEICDPVENCDVTNYPLLSDDIKVENCDEIADLSFPNENCDKIDGHSTPLNNCDEISDGSFSMDCSEGTDLNLTQESQSTLNRTSSEGSQTDLVNFKSISTQTEFEINGQFQVDTKVVTYDDAVKVMLKIDGEIARLTELRQSIFLNLSTNKKKNNNVKIVTKGTRSKMKVKDACKKKLDERKKNKQKNNINKVAIPTTEKNITVDDNYFKKELDFGEIAEKMLVLRVVQDTLLAGTESGKIYYISTKDGTTSHRIDAGGFPVSSICTWTSSKKVLHMFVGSFGPVLRDYDFKSSKPIHQTHIGEGVQCMELSWNFIFIGTDKGRLLRYNLKFQKIEFEESISQDRVLVLKATYEGARRVLLVGSRNIPVCVRDAMSGLIMRTMHEIVAPTVYALLLENSLVYCATTFHDILVFRFHDGGLVRKYQASNSKGIGCMQLVGNLLFASCHNGNIYVYNVKTKQYVGQIEGPGGVILSMEILKNIVIVGTMTSKFKSVLIPQYILDCNRSEPES